MNVSFKERLKNIREFVRFFEEQKNTNPTKVKAMRLLSVYFTVANSVCSLKELVKTEEEKMLFKEINELIPDAFELIALLIALGEKDFPIPAKKMEVFEEEIRFQLNLFHDKESVTKKRKLLENNLEQIIASLDVVLAA